MSVVVVERSFPEPVEFRDIQAIEHRGAWCLQAHDVHFRRSYLSRNRKRMICLYEAPDAESVRLSQQQAGVPFDKAWTARVIRHPGPDADGDAIVVERTLPQPVDEAGVRAAAAHGAECFQQWGCRIVTSFLAGDGARLVCIFAGADAESVRHTQRQTGIPFDVAWAATEHVPQASLP